VDLHSLGGIESVSRITFDGSLHPGIRRWSSGELDSLDGTRYLIHPSTKQSHRCYLGLTGKLLHLSVILV
jgi:hypothetical protein